MKLLAIIFYFIVAVCVSFTVGYYHGKSSLTNVHNDLKLCDMPEECIGISEDPENPDILECYKDINNGDTVYEMRFAKSINYVLNR